MKENLEWMRINAERERISRFKSIAKDSATVYYKILDRFTQELLNSTSSKTSSKENNSEEHEKTSESVNKKQQDLKANEFKETMKAQYEKNQLHNMIRYMTDYLRMVIENGNRYTSNHFFVMLWHLNNKEVENQLKEYIKILIEEIEVPQEQYTMFVAGLGPNKEQLKETLISIQPYLFSSQA